MRGGSKGNTLGSKGTEAHCFELVCEDRESIRFHQRNSLRDQDRYRISPSLPCSLHALECDRSYVVKIKRGHFNFMNEEPLQAVERITPERIELLRSKIPELVDMLCWPKIMASLEAFGAQYQTANGLQNATEEEAREVCSRLLNHCLSSLLKDSDATRLSTATGRFKAVVEPEETGEWHMGIYFIPNHATSECII